MADDWRGPWPPCAAASLVSSFGSCCLILSRASGKDKHSYLVQAAGKNCRAFDDSAIRRQTVVPDQMPTRIKRDEPPSLVWFRLDLRLADNPALIAAVSRGAPVVPVFIWAPEEEGPWSPGAASRWWLHHSLLALEAELRAAGSRLVIRRGPSLETLRQLIQETGAKALFWNRRYEPAITARDGRLEQACKSQGLPVQTFDAALLHEPWTVRNQSAKPYRVFTAFWRQCLRQPEPPQPLPAPPHIPPPRRWPRTCGVLELGLLPSPDWAKGLRDTWRPGTLGANMKLDRFLSQAFAGYEDGRNRPSWAGTSRLSPHLHFGEISAPHIWHAIKQNSSRSRDWRHSQFLTELGWREFAHHLLWHFPRTDHQPLRPEFARFSWRRNPVWVRAWQQGRTGYPFVDAGMRELWTTGWMHNRVRMVVASFLVKDLLVSWQEGARWFWDTLVDADLAQNTLGWQWTAGCGADAAPFFRVFNPAAQGEKFDPRGEYVRRWLPELAALPDEWIHRPHEAPEEVLVRTGIQLGKTYPTPIINHAIAREVALEAYRKIRFSPPQSVLR